MTSYLGIEFPRQLIRKYNMADLLHLVWLALGTARLQIQDFSYSGPGKDVMAAADALLKTKQFEKLAHAQERHVCVGIASQDLSQEFICSRHSERSLTQIRPVELLRFLSLG
jgi:hypothetical protein